MSLLGLLRVAAPLASLYFFSAFAVAQVYAPPCTDASWDWVCISWFRQCILWPLSDSMHCVQTFNSLGQSPCTVIAYMMATCDGGGEFFLRVRALWSHLFVVYTIEPLVPGYTYFGPQGTDDSN